MINKDIILNRIFAAKNAIATFNMKQVAIPPAEDWREKYGIDLAYGNDIVEDYINILIAKRCAAYWCVPIVPNDHEQYHYNRVKAVLADLEGDKLL